QSSGKSLHSKAPMATTLSSDLCYPSLSACSMTTPYSLAMNQSETIYPENKVTAYLATLIKDEGSDQPSSTISVIPSTTTPLGDELMNALLCGDVTPSSLDASQPPQTKRLRRSSPSAQ